jgi:hypothetical protein
MSTKSKSRPVGRRKGQLIKPAQKAATTVRRLLYTRAQTGQALGGISVSSVIRLEQDGKLRTVRLRGESGQVFIPAADVEALAKAVEA